MNEKMIDELLIALLTESGEYSSFQIEDSEVRDCLMDMYFYLLLDDGDKKEKMYQEFLDKYHKLNEQQQELVKNDFIELMNAQDNKEKVKKKGNDKYE